MVSRMTRRQIDSTIAGQNVSLATEAMEHAPAFCDVCYLHALCDKGVVVGNLYDLCKDFNTQVRMAENVLSFSAGMSRCVNKI